MKAAVVVFPGSNCDRDMAVALRAAGFEVAMVWHKEARLPERIDLVAIPGGFSFWRLSSLWRDRGKITYLPISDRACAAR